MRSSSLAMLSCKPAARPDLPAESLGETVRVLLPLQRDPDFKLRQISVSSLIVPLAWLMLFSGVIGAQNGGAQEPAAGSNANSSNQSSISNCAPGTSVENCVDSQLSTEDRPTGATPSTSTPESNGGPHTAPASSQSAAGRGVESQTPNQSGQANRTGQNAPSARRPAEVQPERPQQIQLPIPYSDMPSLRDLYTQIPSAGAKLMRFGSEAFIAGTGNVNELPSDLPVGPDYVLGSGDSIVINMWGGLSNRLTQTIDRQGQIALPEAGSVTINGMTIAEAQDAIQKALSKQFQDEHVEISLGRVRTVRVYVVGDVQRPGAYDVSSLSSPLNALYAAGGPTSRGSLRVLDQYRGKELVRQVDLYDFLLKGVRTDTERLLPGDTLLVPPVGAQVTVEGMVHRPAIYELNGEQNLEQVLNLAGGVLVSASLKQVSVQRVVANERRTMISLQLSGDKAEIARELEAFHVQADDHVVVAQILPYNQQAVFLEGHVYRPGMYAYKDGMTISDLLRSYQDVMPEPSDHAELVRLLPPDFRPRVTSFNLRDVLVGNDSFQLEPFDLIRVYGRYDVDAPMVSIQGEVLHPGDFPMSQGMTVTDLVRMAGGFKRSAYRDEADLSSYEIQNGQKVLVNHSNVAVGKALDGDKSADVVLQPGDVVSIRRLAGWQDIGASVNVSGEVEYAGSYAIQPGEHLSSVLKRAGGFTGMAYPPAAILERVQVREIAEKARQDMIRRIENTPVNFQPGTMSQQSAEAMLENLQRQREQALMALRNEPVTGRMVIDISADIKKWENTPADIELRTGDTLIIPKRPNFVMVAGQVYNPTAISYVPGKDIAWYLRKAGGATRLADKKTIYVLHADGSVVPRGNGWIDTNFMSLRMRPGDTIFVPEKVVGGSQVWQNVIGVAQVAAAAALPLAIAGTL